MPNTETGPHNSAASHTCYNCFAEFEWIPFLHDGEEFCCSGCSDGGPCICTYDGAPHLTELESQVTAVAPREATEEDEGPVADQELSTKPEPNDADDSDEPIPAAAGDAGEPPGPPEFPPAPEITPDDEEPPTNGRLAIIMAAILEMPLPVQEVVRARLSLSGSDEDIGEPFGLTGDEVRQLIEQGQAFLDRSIGTDFRIRYIGAEEMAQDEAPAPEFPAFDDADEDAQEPMSSQPPTDEPTTDEPAQDEPPSDLSQLIARSLDSLTDSSLGEDVEHEGARNVLSEALREVGNLLRIASQRLSSDEPSDMPLREALADAQGSDEPVRLIVENQQDIIPFFMAIQELDSVRWMKLHSQAFDRAEFRLVISSMMAFVRDLMTMEGSLRPSRLHMAGSEITIELPVEPTEQEPASTGIETSGQRFEMSVDSFFGARHFVESGSSAPHHHSYRVEATFVTSEPTEMGFVVGFADVRNMVDSTIMAYSETLLNTEDPFRTITPTTENLARVFYQTISGKLRELDVPSVVLGRVRVWESPTNSASYSNPGADAGSNASVAS